MRLTAIRALVLITVLYLSAVESTAYAATKKHTFDAPIAATFGAAVDAAKELGCIRSEDWATGSVEFDVLVKEIPYGTIVKLTATSASTTTVTIEYVKGGKVIDQFLDRVRELTAHGGATSVAATTEIPVGAYVVRDRPNSGDALVDLQAVRGRPQPVAYVSSPAIRARVAAQKAKDEYRKPDAQAQTDDGSNASVYIYAPPHDAGEFVPVVARETAVQRIVLLPFQATDANDSVEPTRTISDESVLKNVLGAEFKTNGLVAEFPASALKPGYQVVVVYAPGGVVRELRAILSPQALAALEE